MTSKGMAFLFLLFHVLTGNSMGQQESPSWVNAFLKGKTLKVYRSFSPEMQKALPYAKFRKSMHGIRQQFGEFKSLELRQDTAGTSVYELFTEKAYFELHVSQDENGLQGFFIQNAGYRKPEYATHASYYQQHYKIKVDDTLSLPGRLLAPRLDKKVPLVILVHGSGPMDMDETIGPNKVFWDIAQGLAAKGIATFRYDKRTRVSSEWQKSDSLTLYHETILDALQGLNEVWHSELIDTASVWVLGHSLGGYAVPHILQADTRWKGGIIMGGNARPVHQLVTEQVSYLVRLDDHLTLKERTALRRISKIEAAAEAKNWKLLDKRLSKAKGIYYWPTAFFKQTSAYDPVEMLLKETRPVLILHGDRDYQVDSTNLERWKSVASKKTLIQVRHFPTLNHLFIEGNGEPNPGEYFKPGNVSPEVISEIARIIKD